jgi:hypothetical protein
MQPLCYNARMVRQFNRGAAWAAFIVAVACAGRARADDRFELKPGTVYCTAPQPLVTGHIFPLTTSGCEQTRSAWPLVGKPKRAQLGIMRVDMGGAAGVRYVKSFSVVKEGESAPPPAQGGGK